METTTISQTQPMEQQLLVTVDGSVNIESLKRAIRMLRGVTSISRPRTPQARLYDPESGECLNDETMKAVEDGRKGKNLHKFDTFEDYLEYVKNI